MQGLDSSFLLKMTGVEYEVLPSPQVPASLFVIRQLERKSPQFVRPLRVFYILDGAIYLAPSLHSVLSSRLSKVAFHAQSGFWGEGFLDSCLASAPPHPLPVLSPPSPRPLHALSPPSFRPLSALSPRSLRPLPALFLPRPALFPPSLRPRPALAPPSPRPRPALAPLTARHEATYKINTTGALSVLQNTVNFDAVKGYSWTDVAEKAGEDATDEVGNEVGEGSETTTSAEGGDAEGEDKDNSKDRGKDKGRGSGKDGNGAGGAGGKKSEGCGAEPRRKRRRCI